MPIDLPPNSEPDADAVVLSKPFNELAGIPNSTDVRLVAEVSDTTLAFYLNQKAALYARAEIPEYWVLDVVNRRLIVHRRPQGGAYQEVVAYAEAESVAPLAAPESSVLVGTLL